MKTIKVRISRKRLTDLLYQFENTEEMPKFLVIEAEPVEEEWEARQRVGEKPFSLRDNSDGTCNCRPLMGSCFFTDGFGNRCNCRCHRPAKEEKCEWGCNEQEFATICKIHNPRYGGSAPPFPLIEELPRWILDEINGDHVPGNQQIIDKLNELIAAHNSSVALKGR